MISVDIPMICMVIRYVLYWNCVKDHEKFWIFVLNGLLSSIALFKAWKMISANLLGWVNRLLNLSLVFKLVQLEIYSLLSSLLLAIFSR